jgi:DNA-binding HxlR family transcriptional regulator
MDNVAFRSQCPVASALDLFGDSWSLLIIRDLFLSGERTFTDFTRAPERISTARLTDRLRKLEALEVISRERHPTNRKMYLYKLRPKGRDLAPVIAEYVLWSYKHLNDHLSESSKKLAEDLLRDRQEVLDRLMGSPQKGKEQKHPWP